MIQMTFKEKFHITNKGERGYLQENNFLTLLATL